MPIDNFEIIKQHLDFSPIVEETIDENGSIVSKSYNVDCYCVHILRRVKDVGAKFGSNETQRLIKTYEIKNLEYFEKKTEVIKTVCNDNNARAYILLQPRDVRVYLLELSKKIMEALQHKNYDLKIDHLYRSSYCGIHSSRRPIWMLDLDNDEMYGVSKEEIYKHIKENLEVCGRNPYNIWEVPTKNGCHIIFPPINVQKLTETFPMGFKDQKKGYEYNKVLEVFNKYNLTNEYVEVLKNLKVNPFLKISLNNKEVMKELNSCTKNIQGWLHKDATTLLYAP